MIRRLLTVAVLAVTLLACGGGDDEAAEESLDFDEQVCLSVALWSEGLAGTVNRFQADSREASGPAARRDLYLEAWDEVDGVHDELRAELDGLDTAARPYGTAIVDALGTALDASEVEAADGRAEAAGLPEESFEQFSVPDGSLFRGTEKMRALIFHALNETAAVEDADALLGNCGRRPLINERSE